VTIKFNILLFHLLVFDIAKLNLQNPHPRLACETLKEIACGEIIRGSTTVFVDWVLMEIVSCLPVSKFHFH